MPDGNLTKAHLLLEEYKVLSEALQKQQTFIHSVMPGMLTVLAALLAFCASKDLDARQLQWFWVAGAVAIALAYAWTSMSHSMACLLVSRLVEVEKTLNRIVADADQPGGELAFNQRAAADGLGSAPLARAFLLFANLPLLCFLAIGAVRSYESGDRRIYLSVWSAATICVLCLVLTARNSYSTRAKCRPASTEAQAPSLLRRLFTL